jgi:hypothetical protein
MLAPFGAGLGMWVLAGLWHNLVLPGIDENVHPHHAGLGIMLIAYVVLAALSTYLFVRTDRRRGNLLTGLELGIVVGVLWVFPHGLAMAAAHRTSIAYEFKNALWHIVEQGAGGLIIAVVVGAER